MRLAHRLLITGLVVVLTGFTLVAPSFASDPAAQSATVPTKVGEKAKLEWTGTIPPGASTGSDCADPADHHEITLAVPAGTYDDVRVQATISIAYDGPTNDVKFTVVKPDGKKTTADDGFVGTNESVGLTNPAAGKYDVVACMFAGVAPQPYKGTLELEGLKPTTGPTGPSCTAPTQSPKFTEHLIDTERAGGEPIVTTLDDGTLLWGSHAGTTHFYTPAAPDPGTAAFLQKYQGQTYQYFSEDDGKTWKFVPRLITPEPEQAVQGVPASGFSDPEFAVDAAGQVYISEINLANVAVAKSTDGGRSYESANVFAFTSSDRQWMAADAKDVLYMTANGFGGGTFPSDAVGNLGHFMAKSTDGGVTWSKAITSNPNGVADIQIDPRDGTLYEISAATNGELGMAAFRKIRGETSDFSAPEITPIADGVGMTGVGRLIDPTFDMDAKGNLYIVWTENGDGARPAGIWYSYSTDRNKSWAPPVRIDPNENTDIWPWLAVGDPGHVAITYLAVDKKLEGNSAENAEAKDGWNVYVAQTANGFGCAASKEPGFKTTKASSKPVHFGTICMGGTVCQARLVDRRLGDYFANEIDKDGHTYISVSNTAAEEAGGAVALPFIIRQVGGPKFADPTANPKPPTDTDPGRGGRGGGDDGVGDDSDDRSLPATGGGAVALGLLLMGAGLVLRRRAQRATD